MSKPLVIVGKDTTGEDGIRTMGENDARRLLVMDNERIIGIFSTSDVTKLVAMDQGSWCQTRERGNEPRC
jgi:CBS domain-containing protein